MAVSLVSDQDLQVVAVASDTAIDMTGTPIEEYLETRDFGLLKFLPDQEPTVFTLRPLPPGLVADCEAAMGERAYLMAFTVAVKSCNHAMQLGLVWQGSGELQRLDLTQAKRLPSALWKELGQLALERSRLGEGEGRRFSAWDGWRSTRRLLGATSASSATAREARDEPSSTDATSPATT